MAYIITEPCIGTKDTACVDACPVDCIHPKKDELLWLDDTHVTPVGNELVARRMVQVATSLNGNERGTDDAKLSAKPLRRPSTPRVETTDFSDRNRSPSSRQPDPMIRIR